jgi:hypothetical protein
LEPTTPIKPSDAIRLGCLIAPVQVFEISGDPESGEACAIAAMGRGGFTGDVPYPHPYPQCPACEQPGGVVHLNDDHRWTRERIADWLEGLGL